MSKTHILELVNEIESVLFPKLKEHGVNDLEVNDFYFKYLRDSQEKGYELCIPAYFFVKQMKKKPDEISKILCEWLACKELSHIISEVAVANSYVNFNLNSAYLASAVIGTFLLDNERNKMKTGKVVIEFSSPNTNKPQHLGHVRNNCIGSSTSLIYKYIGCDVTRVNLINDRGIHICKSMLAYKLWGNGITPQSENKKGDHLVGDFYVLFDKKFNEEYSEWIKVAAQEEFDKWKNSGSGSKILKKNQTNREKALKIQDEEKRIQELNSIPDDFKAFKDEYKEYYFNNISPIGLQAQDMLLKWEAGDPETLELWNKMNSWVFDGFNETYKTMGIEFDVKQYESQIYEVGKKIILDGYEKGLFDKEENGAISIDTKKKFNLNEGKKILLRGNGTSVYMTQDVGVAVKRIEDYNPDRMIYVVANEQDRHFKILFKIVGHLVPEKKDVCYHLSYGLVNLPTGRMKSREGTVVDADDLIRELQDQAVEITKKKWPELTEEEAVHRALKIGLAALKFYILSFTPDTTIIWDNEKSLQFKGKTGPYLLYTYARTRSIFQKAGIDSKDLQFHPELFKNLTTLEEYSLLVKVFWFPSEVMRAALAYDTSKITDCLFQIAKSFSLFYKDKAKHPIINCQDPETKQARLLLVYAIGNVIKLGLSLLGIETLEQM